MAFHEVVENSLLITIIFLGFGQVEILLFSDFSSLLRDLKILLFMIIH